MGDAAEKEKTVFEKWMEVAEGVVGEIINGNLYVSPRPVPAHSVASSNLGGELIGPFHKGHGGPGGWWILDEPEIHIEENIFVPDIAGWKRERMPDKPKEPYFTVVPDWICEVLSPSTSGYDRAKKTPLYSSLGVKHFWIVDPLHQTLEVYQNENRKWVLLQTYMKEDKVRAAPFEQIEIELSNLWW